MSTIVYLSNNQPQPYLHEAVGKLEKELAFVKTDTNRQDIFDALCFVEEELKGEIDGLMIDVDLTFKGHKGSAGGIELFKHLRFAPVDGPLRDQLENDPTHTRLERLTRMPVVLLTQHEPYKYLREAYENLILLSPGCVMVSSESPEEIAGAYKRLRRFSNRETFRKALLSYITFKDGGGGTTNHSFLNKAGVGKFLHEFAGHILHENDPIRRSVAHVEDQLWIKKMHFKEPGLEWGAACHWDSEEAKDLRELCVDKHIVYVDDQHREGWSYALYAGLFAQRAEDLNPVATELMRDENIVEVRRSRKCLSVIDDNNFAATYLEDFLTNSFPTAMDKWSNSSGQEAQEAERELREAYENLPDLVFLDLRLSHEDENKPPEAITGMQRLVALKEKFPLLPVIVFTAATKKVTADLAQKAQAEALWIKGVSSGAELRAMTQKALVHSREWKELWLLNEMVRHKQNILSYQFDAAQTTFVSAPMDATRKNQICDILEISMSLLRHAIQNNSATHYKYVLLNMGIIQEAIFPGYEKARRHYDDLARTQHPNNGGATAREIRSRREQFVKAKLVALGFSGNQQKLRQLRNGMAHSDATTSRPIPFLNSNFQIHWQYKSIRALFSADQDYLILRRACFGAVKFTLDTLLER